MTDRHTTQPSEHERRVAEEMGQDEERTDRGGLVGTTEPAPGEVGTTEYEQEVEAERRGATAEDLRGEREDEDAPPPGAAYKPRSG